MFTQETYVEYFSELYKKEQEVIALLRRVRDEVSEDHIRQALTEELGRKVRHLAWVEDLLKGLAKNLKAKEVQGPDAAPGAAQIPDNQETMDLLSK